MKYFNYEKYKQQLDDGNETHSRLVIGSIMLFTAYPFFFRTGSLEIIGAMTLVVAVFFAAFKAVRGLYIHSIKIVIPTIALTFVSAACFYISFIDHGKELSYSQPPITDIIALACMVFVFILLGISIYTSKYRINDEP